MATLATGMTERKMSAGRVFERAFATIRRNPAVTIGLALVFGAIPGALSGYMVSAATSDPALLAQNFGAGFFGLMLLSMILGLVIAALVQAVLTRATVADSEGRRAGFGECLGAAFAVILPLILLSILLAIGVGIGFMLLIVPGVMLYTAWAVAAPALVEERRGIFGSFARSAELTKGARWKIFGILLILLVLYYLLSAAAGVFGMSVMGVGGDVANLSAMPPSFIIVSIIVGTLVNVVWGAVQAALFVELRNWKDGPAVRNLEDVFG